MGMLATFKQRVVDGLLGTLEIVGFAA